jgi:hypothetical protein
LCNDHETLRNTLKNFLSVAGYVFVLDTPPGFDGTSLRSTNQGTAKRRV